MKRGFEKVFDTFVRGLGGIVLPHPSSGSGADYLFHEDGVIAELETLEEDWTAKHQQKIQILALEWKNRGLLTPTGRHMRIDLRGPLDPICQREWINMLVSPVESIVREANRQIRGTKAHLNRDSANGLLLVANEGNYFHSKPDEYMNLVAKVLRKRWPTGEKRFPDISAVIFFSYELGSTYDNGAPFWIPGHVGDDLRMRKFQEKLRRGWLDYVSKLRGRPILEIWRPPRE